MTSDEGWLAAMWPFVRAWLPSAPARVLEIGCGPLGGFVPALSRGGYDAVGVDPEAPEGPGYHRVQFERYQSPQPVDCVVACTSLHHVGDLDLVLDLVGAALVPDGAVVVVEWAWERFDEATARWCFARLAPPEPASEPAWLHRRREDWAAAGQPWDACCQAWATHEGLHTGRAITRALDGRSTGGCGPMGRTSSPTFSTPPRQTNRPRSMPGRSIQTTAIRYAGTRR